MRRRRCEGAVVKEVKGLNQNVRCDKPATEVRSLPQEGKKPKEFHYCKTCAGYWDRQQALIRQVVG